jgi:hypothetical protein
VKSATTMANSMSQRFPRLEAWPRSRWMTPLCRPGKWRHKDSLVIRGTRRAPFLPILKLQSQTLGDRNYQRIHLQLLDKATGQLVYELKNTPSYGLGVSSCDYDPRRQEWFLFLAAERIRLSLSREQ